MTAPSEILQPESSEHNLSNLLRVAKYDQLIDSLTRERSSPTKAWNYYLDYLQYLGFEKVPLDIHQRVLRRTVPDTNKLRVLGRHATGHHPRNPHSYEARFQTVIRNIRASGEVPELDDYHFILAQFAVVGHHMGVWHVFKEITSLGLKPTSKTYGLCLQALAHRLTLPCSAAARPKLLSTVSRLCVEILNRMGEQKIQVRSVNFDLAIRVLKDAGSSSDFEKLLKLGYGIDLDNPDCTPVDSVYERDTSILTQMHLPLSTSALNTIVYVLGREGRISKMVQTFEVLTSPLPGQLCRTLDDDEDDVVHMAPHDSDHRPSFVVANATTFNTLISAAAKHGHLALCRHYILQTMQLTYESDRRLSRDLHYLPGDEVAAPTISVNRGTIAPLFAAAHRTKDIEMIRWTLKITQKVIKRKKAAINLLSHFFIGETDDEAHVIQGVKSTTTATSVALTHLSEEDQTLLHLRVKGESGPLEMEVESNGHPNLSPPKIFDRRLHLSLLRRGVEELTVLEALIADALHRTITRVKERLGRRVWQGKNVYMATERTRVAVSRERWRENVGFRTGQATTDRPFVSRAPAGSRRPSWSERLRVV